MDTDNPATGPSDDTGNDDAASSDTTLKNDNHGDDTDNVPKKQTDIVLKHVEVNFVPHVTKEQAANRRRVKPMVKQNTAPKPMATPPPSPTVNGISVFSSFFFFRKNYLLLSCATSVRPSVCRLWKYFLFAVIRYLASRLISKSA